MRPDALRAGPHTTLLNQPRTIQEGHMPVRNSPVDGRFEGFRAGADPAGETAMSTPARSIEQIRAIVSNGIRAFVDMGDATAARRDQLTAASDALSAQEFAHEATMICPHLHAVILYGPEGGPCASVESYEDEGGEETVVDEADADHLEDFLTDLGEGVYPQDSADYFELLPDSEDGLRRWRLNLKTAADPRNLDAHIVRLGL